MKGEIEIKFKAKIKKKGKKFEKLRKKGTMKRENNLWESLVPTKIK